MQIIGCCPFFVPLNAFFVLFFEKNQKKLLKYLQTT